MMTKTEIRTMVWSTMETTPNVGAFPFPLSNRIPNFVGAVQAADRLAALEVFKIAKVLKCCPDSPQIPVRFRALSEGKLVYMAVPRLRALKCFIKLDPSVIPKEQYRFAATIKGATALGVPVDISEMPHIDLVVAGSVAVCPANGARIGKGAGYSDLEFGLATHLGLIDDNTIIVSTVHDVQVIDSKAKTVTEEASPWNPTKHDIPLDVICTPSRVLEVKQRHVRPTGIYWELLDEEKILAIPVLSSIRERPKNNLVVEALKIQPTATEAASATDLVAHEATAKPKTKKNRVQ